MDELFCNFCLEQFKPEEHGAALPCGHLFCQKCCNDQELQSAREGCPVCSTVYSPADVHAVKVLTDPEEPISKWALVGKTPQSAIAATVTSFQFAVRQAELYATIRERQAAAAELKKMQDTCKAKLTQVHQGYKTAKRKFQEAMTAKEAVEADNGELRDKYSQKSMETQQLRDKLPLLQQENDHLRKTCEQLARHAGVDINHISALRGGGGVGGGGGGGGGLSSGSFGHLGISPSTGAPLGNANNFNAAQPRGNLGAPTLRSGGGGGGLPLPSHYPNPSPMVSPGIHPHFAHQGRGNGMDFLNHTPANAGVQRGALLHSGGGGAGLPLGGLGLGLGGGGGGGGGGSMPPPGNRMKRQSLVPHQGGGKRAPYGGGGGGGGGGLPY